MEDASPPKAPRFHFYFQRIEGRSVFVMRRTEWEELEGHKGQPVLIDIKQTPMSGVAREALVVAAVAERVSPAMARITICRYDQKDQPSPYNIDTYLVWKSLPGHLDYLDMVNAASTEDNENLRRYLRENVFIVRENPANDHWLPELPAKVLSLIRGA